MKLRICAKHSSPFTSIRLFGTYLLYKKANEKNIKVIIEGHGGDEMTAGYKYNYLPYIFDKNKINLNSNYKLIKEKLLKNENIKLDKATFKTINFQGLSTTDGTPNFFKNIFNQDFIDQKKLDYNTDKLIFDKIIKKHGFLKTHNIKILKK